MYYGCSDWYYITLAYQNGDYSLIYWGWSNISYAGKFSLSSSTLTKFNLKWEIHNKNEYIWRKTSYMNLKINKNTWRSISARYVWFSRVDYFDDCHDGLYDLMICANDLINLIEWYSVKCCRPSARIGRQNSIFLKIKPTNLFSLKIFFRILYQEIKYLATRRDSFVIIDKKI